MRFLRDVWQREPIHKIFAGLEPIDRATFLIVVGLALALGFSVHVLLPRYFRAEPMQPAFTAPPLELRTVRA